MSSAPAVTAYIFSTESTISPNITRKKRPRQTSMKIRPALPREKNEFEVLKVLCCVAVHACTFILTKRQIDDYLKDVVNLQETAKKTRNLVILIGKSIACACACSSKQYHQWLGNEVKREKSCFWYNVWPLCPEGIPFYINVSPNIKIHIHVHRSSWFSF